VLKPPFGPGRCIAVPEVVHRFAHDRVLALVRPYGLANIFRGFSVYRGCNTPQKIGRGTEALRCTSGQWIFETMLVSDASWIGIGQDWSLRLNWRAARLLPTTTKTASHPLRRMSCLSQKR
jgi:hypothetical protein